VIHFGFIASGDLVVKSAYHRDEIAARENVIAFEMEGAGVWDNFPTVVIKGVCATTQIVTRTRSGKDMPQLRRLAA
jgi:nucleoside phosphorylase